MWNTFSNYQKERKKFQFDSDIQTSIFYFTKDLRGVQHISSKCQVVLGKDIVKIYGQLLTTKRAFRMHHPE